MRYAAEEVTDSSVVRGNGLVESIAGWDRRGGVSLPVLSGAELKDRDDSTAVMYKVV